MIVVVRRARPADAVRLRRVHVASIRGLSAGFYTRAQIASWSASRPPGAYRRAMAEGEVMFIARIGDRTAGFAGRKDGRVRAVYVHPRYARRGIGAMLLAALERDARRRGLRRLALSSSLQAVRFYRAQGYTAGRRSHHTLRDGTRMPCVPMTKRLVRRGRRHKSR